MGSWWDAGNEHWTRTTVVVTVIIATLTLLLTFGLWMLSRDDGKDPVTGSGTSTSAPTGSASTPTSSAASSPTPSPTGAISSATSPTPGVGAGGQTTGSTTTQEPVFLTSLDNNGLKAYEGHDGFSFEPASLNNQDYFNSVMATAYFCGDNYVATLTVPSGYTRIKVTLGISDEQDPPAPGQLTLSAGAQAHSWRLKRGSPIVATIPVRNPLTWRFANGNFGAAKCVTTKVVLADAQFLP